MGEVTQKQDRDQPMSRNKVAHFYTAHISSHIWLLTRLKFHAAYKSLSKARSQLLLHEDTLALLHNSILALLDLWVSVPTSEDPPYSFHIGTLSTAPTSGLPPHSAVIKLRPSSPTSQWQVLQTPHVVSPHTLSAWCQTMFFYSLTSAPYQHCGAVLQCHNTHTCIRVWLFLDPLQVWVIASMGHGKYAILWEAQLGRYKHRPWGYPRKSHFWHKPHPICNPVSGSLQEELEWMASMADADVGTFSSKLAIKKLSFQLFIC